jgi:ketosteroid isomerase-like protein
MQGSSEHPNVAVVGETLGTLARGDAGPVYARMREDFAMRNDVGAGPWREIDGRDAVMAFWTRWAEWFAGTFRQDVTDAIGWDDRVVLFVHETGTVSGEPFDNRAIYVLDIDADGGWTGLRTLDMDPQNCARFWSRVDAPATV